MPTGRKKRRTSRKPATKTRGRSTAPRTTPKRKTPAPQRPALLGGLTEERKIDLLGVGLVLIGLVTLLSIASTNRGGLTGSWVVFLTTFFGWGVPILAVVMLVIGAWLVARNVERLPQLSIERIVGILLLFLNLLTFLHWAGSWLSGSDTNMVEGQAGGGYIGGLIYQFLALSLGDVGTIIALVAWFLIALTMTLDISLQEMFAWVGPLTTRIRDKQKERSQQTPAKTEQAPLYTTQPPGEFTPITRPPGPAQIVAVPGVKVKTGVPSTPMLPWVLPKAGDILETALTPTVNKEFVEQRARLIEETLASFGAPSQVIEISRGPTITMFGVEPLFIETRNGRTRVRVSRIVSLADDLALALAAPRIRIQAPVPGRGYVGIEVPNEEMTLVTLREVVETEVFQRVHSSLRFALGKDVAGIPVVANLAAMPHLLIAGTTGSGKSVCVNAILSCLLLHNTPDELRLILVDPKRVELSNYNGIPHLLAPVVMEIERVIGALQWMMREMDNRYHKFAQSGARNITDYNARAQAQGGKKLPFLVIVIDELADLMMISPDEAERTITRLAQLARATGIHLIIATQRPSVDVVTGLIKANFPARIAFAVASNVDSRVILDQPGAERLLGRGDMLFQSPDASAPTRLQGVFVSDTEISRLVDYWRQQAGASSPYAVAGTPGDVAESIPQGSDLRQVPMFEEMIPEPKVDPLLQAATEIVRREGRASVSMLQRKLRVGYTRAARLIDTLEEKGIIGSPQGNTQMREVLDDGSEGPPKDSLG